MLQNWYRWSRGDHFGSWHIASSDHSRTLCGRAIPDPAGDVAVSSLVGVEPTENEKTCETCLRVSHRDVENDL